MTTWTSATEAGDDWDEQGHAGAYCSPSYVEVDYLTEQDEDTDWTSATEASPGFTVSGEASTTWTSATEASTTWTDS